jgi:RNA polymerase sigma-70 factor (ECF subfamily)
MNHEPDDGELMAAIAAGDAQAFDTLADRYLDKAVSFCTRMVRSKDIAEDIAQEAFARLWHNASAWKPTAKFNTWFFTVLHNASLNAIRNRKSRRESDLEDIHASADIAQDEKLVNEEKTRLVKQAVDALPERQRSAIMLSYYEGFSQREAASMLGVTEGAFESLLSRARGTLETTLKCVAEEKKHG